MTTKHGFPTPDEREEARKKVEEALQQWATRLQLLAQDVVNDYVLQSIGGREAATWTSTSTPPQSANLPTGTYILQWWKVAVLHLKATQDRDKITGVLTLYLDVYEGEDDLVEMALRQNVDQTDFTVIIRPYAEWETQQH